MANYPSLKEIVNAVDKLIDLKLAPIKLDISRLQENMVTKVEIADLVIEFYEMKTEVIIISSRLDKVEIEMRDMKNVLTDQASAITSLSNKVDSLDKTLISQGEQIDSIVFSPHLTTL